MNKKALIFSTIVMSMCAVFPNIASACETIEDGLKQNGLKKSDIQFKTYEDDVWVTYYVHFPKPIKGYNYGTLIVVEECLLDERTLLTDADFKKEKALYSKHVKKRVIRGNDED